MSLVSDAKRNQSGQDIIMFIASLLRELTGRRETTFRVRLGKKQVEPEDVIELNASDSADGLSLTGSFLRARWDATVQCGR